MVSEPDIGWMVLDPDGNVVAAGPVTELEMTSELGEALNLEGAADVGD